MFKDGRAILTGCGRVARLLGLVATLGGPATAGTEPACTGDASGPHTVVDVIDSETVRLDDGQEIRLIGALAPASDMLQTARAALAPARDAQRLLADLVGARSVRLRFGGRRQDRYGRTLAQLFVRGPEGDDWVQRRLILAGYARAYALPGSAACLEDLMGAEAEARAAQRGLWGQGLYVVHRAEDVAPLLRLAGHFAVVQGRVAHVAHTQRLTYINFGADWRRDFTVSLPSAVVKRSAGGRARASALAGTEIRVRGWIERRNGPMIEIGALDEIEILGAAPAPTQGDAAGACSPPACGEGSHAMPYKRDRL